MAKPFGYEKVNRDKGRATPGCERKQNIMNPMANIPVGATGTVSVEVTRELTVAHLHSGMPEVYGTPMMIYLLESASAKAVANYLPEGWVSVGVVVNIKHLAATPIGGCRRSRSFTR